MRSGAKTPKFAAIKAALLREIREGRYVDRLPGERAIARQHRVSHMTARRAVDALVGEGILYREPDRGTFLRRPGKGGARTGNIGYVLLKEQTGEDPGSPAAQPRTSGGPSIESPYYALLFRHLAAACRRRSLGLLFQEGFSDVHPFGERRSVDGLVVSYFPWMRAAIAEVARHNPVVLIDNSDPTLSLPSVLIDNVGGTRQAVDHLIQRGHRRIGYLSGPMKVPVGAEKLRGYREALAAADIAPRRELVYSGDFHFQTGVASAAHFLSLPNRPTAVACGNDTMAMGLMKGLLERGVRIPGEISVVGFDDVEPAAQVFPALSTVRVDYADLGEACLDRLVRAIQGESPPTEPYRVATTLVERDSVAAPRE